MSDQALVVLAQTRNLAAFQQLVARYDRRLTYYVRRLMGGNPSDCDDVLQEVWILVHRRLSSLTAPEAFRCWLYKIAHDVTVSSIRKLVRQPSPSTQVVNELGGAENWDEFEAIDRVEVVHRTLERLPPDQRAVLTLRFLEQMSIQEISDVVGCETGTVKSRLHYAKATLRQQLQGVLHD